MRWLQNHSFIFLCIVFTVASQLIMRWRVGGAGALPASLPERVNFVIGLLMTPWIWLAIGCTFLAGVSWMLALTRFELSYAFPFTGISFLLILLASSFIFSEQVTLQRALGTLLVAIGLIVVVRS